MSALRSLACIPRLLPAALAGLLLSTPALAQDALTAEDYAAANNALVEGHVVPRYRAFEEATERFAQAAERACAAELETSAEALRLEFHNTMDAWMGVEHLRFGPSQLFLRAYRVAFWPQAQGKFGEAVAELLAEGDPAQLSRESFSGSGVAIQGLPAAEQLIFGDASPDDSAGPVAPCDLLAAIGRNLSEIAEGLREDWRAGERGFALTVKQPGEDNAYFATHQEATLALFQALHDELQLIADVKLKPVLGDAPRAAKPALAESPLSQRSLRNIEVNLEALQALYLGEGGAGLSSLVVASGADPDLDPLMRKAFRLTLENARSIELPLVEAVSDDDARPRVEKLLTQVTALKQIVKTRVAEALGLSVGFNALDGD